MKILLVFGLLFALSSADDSKSDVEKILRPTLNAYVEAVVSGDYDKAKEYYHANAISVETDKNVWYKPDKIIEAVKKYYAENPKSKSAKVESEEFSGGGKVISYKSQWTFPDQKGHQEGPYFQIWVLDTDGKWKVYHEEYSLDAPKSA
ncbi:unnamed protein product, partial [Mesorhabditis belari]|uniref:DUF4440 domain-containing protein n=1 Tax=Mesorhabditis belari TaxID=2138241 RepID=A0AAF3EMM1_9BILA